MVETVDETVDFGQLIHKLIVEDYRRIKLSLQIQNATLSEQNNILYSVLTYEFKT